MGRRRTAQAILACSAAAGLVGAHVIAYIVALPDPAVRATVLRATGHGYFSAAAVAAVVAGIFGVLGAAALGYRRGGGMVRPVGLRHTAVRVAAIQSAAFVILEVAERAAANVPLVTMNVRLLLIGIGVQALLGCLAAAIVLLVCRTAAAVWRALHGPPRIRGRVERRVAPFDALVSRPALAGAFASRAPPSPPR
jgi:hypothetical protein